MVHRNAPQNFGSYFRTFPHSSLGHQGLIPRIEITNALPAARHLADYPVCSESTVLGTICFLRLTVDKLRKKRQFRAVESNWLAFSAKPAAWGRAGQVGICHSHSGAEDEEKAICLKTCSRPAKVPATVRP